MLVSPPSRTMDQDEKVSAAALQLSISSTRPGRVGSASEIGFDGAGEVVGSASAMGPGIETDEGSSDLPASQASDKEASDDGTTDEQASAKAPRTSTTSQQPPKKVPNNVRKIRIERMMSKAELARRANLSVLTIDRVERGYGCRMDTKR